MSGRYQVPTRMHDELQNWSRWCNLGAWSHPLPRSQCGSLEGDYRPPVWEAVDMEEAPPPPRIRPNERNARKVQEAWESFPEGSMPRLALKAEYPSRVPEQGRTDRAESLGLSVQQYENNLQIAVNRVEEAFAVRA